jgi:hypothetical protein
MLLEDHGNLSAMAHPFALGLSGDVRISLDLIENIPADHFPRFKTTPSKLRHHAFPQPLSPTMRSSAA